MKKSTSKKAKRTTAARTTARATTDTTSAENSAASAPADEMTDDTDAVTDDHVPAAQQDLAVGDDDPEPAVPANMGNFSGINTDNFFEAKLGSIRGLKFGVAESIKAAAEVREFEATLGDAFLDFARIRLGLTPQMAHSFLRLAALNLDTVDFSPAVEVRLPRLMEVLCAVVAAYNTINVTPPDSIDNVAPATNPTTTPATTVTTSADMMMPTTPTANSVVTPAAPESPVDVTVATPPRANTIVQPQVAADVVIGVAPPDGQRHGAGQRHHAGIGERRRGGTDAGGTDHRAAPVHRRAQSVSAFESGQGRNHARGGIAGGRKAPGAKGQEVDCRLPLDAEPA